MQGYSNGLPLSRDHLVFVYVYNNYISIHVGDCYVLVNSDVITTCPVENHLILVMKTSVWFRCQTVLFLLTLYKFHVACFLLCFKQRIKQVRKQVFLCDIQWFQALRLTSQVKCSFLAIKLWWPTSSATASHFKNSSASCVGSSFSYK